MSVGVITGAHGLRGEVRVHPETDEPSRFAALTEVRLAGPEGEELPATIAEVRVHGRGLLVRFEGVRDRDQAEALKGWEIRIQRRMALPLAEGEFFIADIIGLVVVTVGGQPVGRVTEVLRTGANDVYVTPRALIPATKEIVKRIDLQAGRIVIEPMEGLL